MSATFAPWNPERAKTSVAAAMIRSRVCALRGGRGGGCAERAAALGPPRLPGSSDRSCGAQRRELLGVIARLDEHFVGVLTVSRCRRAVTGWRVHEPDGKPRLRCGSAITGIEAHAPAYHLPMFERLPRIQHRLHADVLGRARPLPT